MHELCSSDFSRSQRSYSCSLHSMSVNWIKPFWIRYRKWMCIKMIALWATRYVNVVAYVYIIRQSNRIELILIYYGIFVEQHCLVLYNVRYAFLIKPLSCEHCLLWFAFRKDGCDYKVDIVTKLLFLYNFAWFFSHVIEMNEHLVNKWNVLFDLNYKRFVHHSNYGNYRNEWT